MDAKSLRDIQRKEKMSPYLQPLEKDFYDQLRAYLRSLLEDIRAAKGVDTSKLALKIAEYENIKNMVSDLYETRERKIVSNALYYVKSGDEVDAENLTREEEEVLRKIVELLREKRRQVLEKALEGGEEAAKEKQEHVTVRILKDLPSIVGVDGRVYGAFKREDIVSLPRANAETLINRGAAERVDVSKLYI
jgi:DNA replication initiation complex subunit (GINS family)